MPSDQDQDGGEHGRASHNSADVPPGSRQRLAGRIPERRVDLARRGHAGQLVVAAVVVVHLEAALSLQARQPARARSVRVGSVGSVGPARRRGGRGVAFMASFLPWRRVSTDRSRGSRGASEPRLPCSRGALAYVLRVSGPWKAPSSSTPLPRPERTVGLHLYYECS